MACAKALWQKISLPCIGVWEDAWEAGMPREMGTHAAQ